MSIEQLDKNYYNFIAFTRKKVARGIIHSPKYMTNNLDLNCNLTLYENEDACRTLFLQPESYY